jgi:hypothetical protein
MKFTELVSRNLGRPQGMAEALTGRATRWIADRFGVSMTTARRWRNGTQQTRDTGRREGVMKSADRDTRRKVAAGRMRQAQGINVGKLGVKPDTGDQKEQTRNLGFIRLGEQGQALMQQAGDALDRGDDEEAARLQSEAILHADGRDYGPMNATDYGAGFYLV